MAYLSKVRYRMFSLFNGTRSLVSATSRLTGSWRSTLHNHLGRIIRIMGELRHEMVPVPVFYNGIGQNTTKSYSVCLCNTIVDSNKSCTPECMSDLHEVKCWGKGQILVFFNELRQPLHGSSFVSRDIEICRLSI